MKQQKYNSEFLTNAYAEQIIAGEIICCQAELLLAKKHLRDLKRQGTKAFPYIFDETRAERFFKFFHICKNPDTGKYYEMLPHQYFDLGIAYGWVHKDTGVRKYSKVFDFKSRGTAKTTVCAIESMYNLCSDKIYPPFESEKGYVIPNATILLMAVDKGQAELLRKPIVKISEISPKLLTRINAKQTYIKGKKYGGEIRILSKESKNKQGEGPNLVVVDEYSSHTDNKRAEAAKKGLGKKLQGTIKYITTANDNEQSNPAKKEYDYAKKVLTGKIIDESYLPIIRETEPDDDISNVKIWSKANPMFRYLGEYQYSDTLYTEVLGEYKRAFEGNDPDLKREFKIFRMNMWQEKSVKSYLNEEQMRKLDSLAVSKENFAALTHGKQKITGLDFSIRKDLTADGDVFLLEDGRIAIDAHGYITEDKADEKEKTDKVPYREWEKQGYITIMDYPAVNQTVVAEEIIRRATENEQDIAEFAYDPHKAYQIAMDLMEGKYGKEYECIEIGQTVIAQNIPTDKLRGLIIEGNLVWNGNPALRTHFENAYEYTNKREQDKDKELIKICKVNKDSGQRIDMVAAVINALARVDQLKQTSFVDKILKEGFEF